MRQFFSSITRLFFNPGSKLHIIYFIDHAKSKTLILNRFTAIFLFGSLGLLALACTAGLGFTLLQLGDHKALLVKAHAAKEELLSYQFRYDQIWEKAYPELLTAMPEQEVPPTDTNGTPMAQIDPTPAKIVPDTTTLPAGVITATPAIEEKQLNEAVVVASETLHPDKRAKTSPFASAEAHKESLKVENLRVEEKADYYQITFDLHNHSKDKAKGFFWGEIVYEIDNQQISAFSHKDAPRLNEHNSTSWSQLDIPTFSIQRMRHCFLRVNKPTMQAGSVRMKSAQIYISNPAGQILRQTNLDLTKVIATKRSKPTATLQ